MGLVNELSVEFKTELKPTSFLACVASKCLQFLFQTQKEHLQITPVT